MTPETGVVTRVSGDHVWVRARSKIDCQRCAAGQGCGGATFSRLLGRRLLSVRASTTESLAVGQKVLLQIQPRHLLQGALMAYLFPTLVMLLGAALGERLVPGDWGAVAGAGLGLFSCVVLSQRFGQSRSFAARFQPQAVSLPGTSQTS